MTGTPSNNMAQRQLMGGDARASARAVRRWVWITPAILLVATGCSALLSGRSPAAAPAQGAATRATTRVRGAAVPSPDNASPRPVSPADDQPTLPEPEPTASDSAGIARLIRLAHVWHTASLHHPAIATRGVPWDSALIIAATRVRSATTSESLIEAYRRMFRVLGDPIARVEPRATPPRAPVPLLTERLGDSVLLIRLSPDAALDAADSALLAQVLQPVPARVLLDLRGALPSNAYQRAQQLDEFLERTGFVRSLVQGTIASPVVRSRQIGVAPSTLERHRGGVRATAVALEATDAWQVSEAKTYRGDALHTRRVVVLADSGSVFPGVLLAMHDAVQVSLIADGPVSDQSTVPYVHVPLDSTHDAVLRIGELLHLDGTLGVVPDTVLSRNGDADVARQAAITLVQGSMRLPTGERPLPVFVTRAATPVFYDTTAYPFMGARLLGGFRLWSAMRSRHALRDAYDDDLDAVFERVIPKLEAARSQVDYAAAIADLATSMDDEAATPVGTSYESAVGDAALPFRLHTADGRVFVTDVISDSTTTRLGIARGTEIIAVDGYPIGAWLSERRRLAPASNEWTRTRLSLRHLVRGRDGVLIMKVRDATNRERTLEIPRRAEYRTALPTFERPADAPIRMLSDGVWYVDMERLDTTSITSALGRLGTARAVLLDLRGRLTLDDSLVLTRFASQPSAPLAQVVQRTITEPCLASIRQAALQCTDVRVTRTLVRQLDTNNVFTGRVVALIDERTSGAMERFALALEQLSNVTFVGSSSAGAVNVATPLSLPGGLVVGIATHEVRRADGGQLQRVGLTPSVDARPTVRGLRSGDDDVLIRAQQWVQQQLEPPRRGR